MKRWHQILLIFWSFSTVSWPVFSYSCRQKSNRPSWSSFLYRPVGYIAWHDVPWLCQSHARLSPFGVHMFLCPMTCISDLHICPDNSAICDAVSLSDAACYACIPQALGNSHISLDRSCTHDIHHDL